MKHMKKYTKIMIKINKLMRKHEKYIKTTVKINKSMKTMKIHQNDIYDQ